MRIACLFALATVTLAPGLVDAQQCEAPFERQEVRDVLEKARIMPFTQRERLSLYRAVNGEEPRANRSWSADTRVSTKPWNDFLDRIGVGEFRFAQRYTRCNVAFAQDLLSDRVAEYGADHPYVRRWIGNQTIVFQGCGGPSPNGQATLTLHPDDTDPAMGHDLAYQEAAYDFYSGEYDAAMEKFRAIAKVRESAFCPFAHYMVARLLLGSGADDQALSLLDAILADPELAPAQLIAGDLVGVIAYRRESARLYARQLATIDEVLGLPAALIERRQTLQRHWIRAMRDLNWFLRINRKGELDEDWWLGGRGGDGHARAVSVVAQQSDRIDWLQTTVAFGQYHVTLPWLGFDHPRVQRPAFRRVTDHALRRWRRGDGLHWALAAIGRIGPDRDAVPDLLRLADDVRGRIAGCGATAVDLAVFPLLFYHSVRLHLMRGDIERGLEMLVEHEGRSWSFAQYAAVDAATWLIGNGRLEDARRALSLDFSPPADSRYVWGDVYRLYRLRRLAAADMDGFLDAIGDRRMGAAAAALLNLLPVRVLARLAVDERLKQEDRAEIARAAWTRAHLLGMSDARDALTPTLRAFHPSLAPFLDRIDEAWLQSTADRLTVHMLAANPRLGIQIDPYYVYLTQRAGVATVDDIDRKNHNDNNWWCKFDPARTRQILHKWLFAFAMGVPTPQDVQGQYGRYRRRMLSHKAEGLHLIGKDLIKSHPLVALIDDAEIEALAALPNGPKYIGEAAIEWSRETNFLARWLGQDALLPETLHRAVVATRYGCQRNGGHRAYSHAAFHALHHGYPDSEWTKRTPYWFDAAHFRHRYRR